MASNGASRGAEDTKTSLEKIKRQLASGSGRNLLQGPLLKRSETMYYQYLVVLFIYFIGYSGHGPLVAQSGVELLSDSIWGTGGSKPRLCRRRIDLL
nr:switch-associated protein 70 [Ipomoea batatas]